MRLILIALALASVLLLLSTPPVVAPRGGSAPETFVRDYGYTIGECGRGVMTTFVRITRVADETFIMPPTHAGKGGHVESGDWYVYHFTQTTNPGTAMCAGSNWETAHTYLQNDVADRAGTRHLSDWGPHGNDPIKGAEVSWAIVGYWFLYGDTYTYHVPWVWVHDLSDRALNGARGRFYIQHDFDEANDPADGPSTTLFSTYPLAVINTDECGWSLTDATYSVLWMHHEWWGWGSYLDYNQSPYYVDAVDPCTRSFP